MSASAHYPLWGVIATAVAAFVVPPTLMRIFLRERILERLNRDEGFKSWYENVDAVAAIVAAILATSWKVYDLGEWEKADGGFMIALSLSFGLAGIVVYSKLLKSRAAIREKKSISKYETEIATLTDARNWLVGTAQLIDIIVGEKCKRRQSLLEKKALTPQDVISVTATKTQILLIVQSIHEFFAERLEYNSSLRLGIYFRSDSDHDLLERGYSWDGKTEDCFSAKSAEYLKIVRTHNVLSELAKCFHSDEGIIIVPDCKASAARGEFQYLYVEQETRIRSLVVYRFNVVNGKGEHPWIIYLDTDQPGFFDVSKKAEYKLFFERVAKRLSFELVTLELASKLTIQAPT